MVIAFRRSLGTFPARYVSGYALGLEPFDFHAFAQVYLGGRWHNVDATYDGTREALIPIATGRDAADLDTVTFLNAGTFKGQELEIRKISSRSRTKRNDHATAGAPWRTMRAGVNLRSVSLASGLGWHRAAFALDHAPFLEERALVSCSTILNSRSGIMEIPHAQDHHQRHRVRCQTLHVVVRWN